MEIETEELIVLSRQQIHVNKDLPKLKNESHKNELTYNIYLFAKRATDIILSCFSIVMLIPLFIIVSVIIKLEDHGPVFYSQIRLGKDEKPFKMFKFRSMCQDADAKLKELELLNERDGPAFKIANDPRITRIGRFIRKTCIDELPQLINILKGDMSIVGPRPPLPKEVEKYSTYDKQRLNVTPGLTCYWQISKHDTISFKEWVELDLKYIKQQSFLTDIRIIFKTMKVVVYCKGEK